MNRQQANSILLSQILEKLGIKHDPFSSTPIDLWYFSPFKLEATPSFHINPEKNIWYDFGLNIGGNTLDFVCYWLKVNREDSMSVDALRWITNMTKPIFANSHDVEQSTQSFTQPSADLILKKIKTIGNIALKKYLEKFNIPLNLASQYLKEVRVFDPLTQREHFYLGFLNEEEGFELQNSLLKTRIGSKGVTVIQGSQDKPHTVNLFAGVFDMLGAMTYQGAKAFKGDIIVLNDLSLLPQAIGHLHGWGYKKLYNWLGDSEQEKTLSTQLEHFIALEPGLTYQRMILSNINLNTDI